MKDYHTTRHEVLTRRATAAQPTTQGHQHRPEEEDDEAPGNDAGRPRMAQIVRHYNRIPTTDGYIERRGNQQVQVHYIDTPPPTRRAGRQTEEAPPRQEYRRPRTPRRFHWLVFVGLFLFVMIVGYVSLNAVGSWWQIHQDDSTYGRPRTYQTDTVVGHSDSPTHPSHFIAMNLNRHIVIVEIPGGDISKTIIYTGPTLLGDGQDLTPVTLSFQDVNGDGRPDMIVHILDQTTVYLNNGSKFLAPVTNTVDRGSTLPLSLEGRNEND